MKKYFSRVLLIVISVAVTVVCIELILPLILEPLSLGYLRRQDLRYKLEHQDFTVEQEVQGRAKTEQLDWMENDVMHPYLGFVRNPQVEEGHTQYGFLGEQSIYKKNDDTVIVGVFGGSVAWYVYVVGQQELINQLQTIPEFHGRKIQLVSVALGGFKEPQQLFALNYLLSLGGEFDMIINIDGFNDAALPYSDNFGAGISPYFPRHWNYYSRKSIDPDALPIIAQVTQAQQRKTQWAGAFRHTWLKHSQLMLLVWYFFDNRIETHLNSLNTKLQNVLQAQEATYQIVGPQPPQTKEEVFKESLDVWANSSLQLARLAAANGIRYYQVLQPNQYLPGSKKMNETEKKSAFIDSLPDDSLVLHAYKYKEAVEVLYPQMRQRGQKMKQDNQVTFIDATQIFHDSPETIYVDPCCHYNAHGTTMLIQSIMEPIRADLRERPLKTTQKK